MSAKERKQEEGTRGLPIQGYGKVVMLPEAAVQPDRSLDYKVVFELGKDEERKDGLANKGLDRVARFVNLMAAAEVRTDKLDVAVVVHGKAAATVLNDEQYRRGQGRDNPNLGLIRALAQAGVKVFVCGQSLAEQGYGRDWIIPEVAVALAAIVLVPTYQLRGYAYVQL